MIEFKFVIRCPTCGDAPDENGEFHLNWDVQAPSHYVPSVLADALRGVADELDEQPRLQ